MPDPARERARLDPQLLWTTRAVVPILATLTIHATRHVASRCPMSSKKRLRQKRKQEKAQAQRRGLSPATLFIIITLALIVVLVVVAYLTGDARPNAPRPGAVWSEAHGHWH